ncbi:hypothetical protein Fmac_028058 [Flemingia macrophylla]|uniref:Uncharacterized protein n=1 Tax=Flemingia macrophylla TaxID=520843 RepID=A0ABD1LJJ7_9FABA
MKENVVQELQQMQPDEQTENKMLDILKRFHSEEEMDEDSLMIYLLKKRNIFIEQLLMGIDQEDRTMGFILVKAFCQKNPSQYRRNSACSRAGIAR